MSLEKYTTTQTEHIHVVAQDLAKRVPLAIRQLEPIADFEELLTFDEAQSTPIEFTPQYPAWRLESVAARIIEAVAIAAHEPLSASEYRDLARILLAHAEYLYAYPDGDPVQDSKREAHWHWQAVSAHHFHNQNSGGLRDSEGSRRCWRTLLPHRQIPISPYRSMSLSRLRTNAISRFWHRR